MMAYIGNMIKAALDLPPSENPTSPIN